MNQFNNLYNKIIKEAYEWLDQKKTRLKKEFLESIDDRQIYKVAYNVALGTIAVFNTYYICTKAYTEEEAIEMKLKKLEKSKNPRYNELYRSAVQ